MNQTKFIGKFDEMKGWHEAVSKGFEYFTEVQLPELDNVLHKHIDILRVAEQDHYNKLNSLLKKGVTSRGSISDDIDTLKEITKDVEAVKSDYVKSQAQLGLISNDLTKNRDIEVLEMRNKIDELSESVSLKIEESLAKLHEHYHMANGEISQSVKILAKQAQLKSEYGDIEN